MGKRTKIAPVLTALLNDLRIKAIRFPLRRSDVGDLQIVRLARSEHRALLAVAADHGRLLTYAAGYIGGTGTVRRDIWEEHPVLAKSLKVRARLSRASGKGEKP